MCILYTLFIDFVIDINDVYKFKAWACGMSFMQFEKLCITLPCISFLDTLHIYICLLPSPEHAEGLVVMMLILNVSKQWSSEFILNNEPIGSLPKHRQELVLSLIIFLYVLVHTSIIYTLIIIIFCVCLIGHYMSLNFIMII